MQDTMSYAQITEHRVRVDAWEAKTLLEEIARKKFHIGPEFRLDRDKTEISEDDGVLLLFVKAVPVAEAPS